MIQRILQFICFSLIVSSCASIRSSNRIEKAFLASYKRDLANGQTPKTYTVTDKTFKGRQEYIRSTIKTPSGPNEVGHYRTSLDVRSIDVYLIDTITGELIIIDDFKNIAKLTRDNIESQQYLKKFKRQKTMQKVHRYGAHALMVGGIAILSSVKEGSPPSKSERIKGNTGAYILLGGFFDWIGGSLARALNRRATTMKAAYVYHFGKPPKRWTSLK